MSLSLPSGLRIGFIGGGAMASAIAKGIGGAKLVPYSSLHVSDIHLEGLTDLAALGMHVTRENGEVASACDVLFLCTKPDIVIPALRAIAGRLRPDVLLISIAAGLPLAAMEGAVPPGTKIVRCMPNTPALVACSATAYALGASCTPADDTLVRTLLRGFGLCVSVRESDLDAVTGLSGSGPAYVFLLIESLADGGVRAGLTRPIAQQLAIQTVLGSAKLLEATGRHPAQMKDQVASPGGTTIAGLHALEQGAFRATLISAVQAATKRAKELGEMQIKAKL